MRGLFLNVPMTGHINPTLAFVQELIKNGDEIIYYCTEEYRDKIERSGATFRAYDLALADIDPSTEPSLPSLGVHFLGMSMAILDRHLEEWRKLEIDYIITDSCLMAGPIAARALDVCGATSTTTFVLLPAMLYKGASPREMMRVLFSDLASWGRWWKTKLECRRRYGCSPSLFDIVTTPQSLNFVYTSRHFQPMAESLDPEVHRFLGPMLRIDPKLGELPWDLAANRKLIYASLGTTYNAKPSFFKKCIEALAGWDDVLVILSVGKNIDMNELAVPNNFVVRSSVPQLEVLQRADLFISHGGMNSINEAMHFGVPVIVCPQQGEQNMVGDRVAALGAGINTKLKEPDPTSLRQLAEHVMETPSYRKAAQAIGQSFQQVEGAEGGVRALHNHVRAYAGTRGGYGKVQPSDRQVFENA